MTTTTPPGRPRPYQRGVVRLPRPDVVVVEGEPLAQITIYEQLILLARRDRRSGAWRQHPVTAEAMAQALAGLPSGSGLLPPNTLASGSVHGKAFLAIWIPPGHHTLRTAEREYKIPLPPMVWAGCGDDYRVWALGAEGATFPTAGSTPLYAMPAPNTYPTGAICWGSSDPRPAAASPAALAKAWATFLGSNFNSHIQASKSKAYPASVLALWELLAERVEEPYPLEDLIRAPHDLAWVCRGEPWKEAS